MSVEVYAIGGSVVAGLVPATSRRYGISPRISAICVSVIVFLWRDNIFFAMRRDYPRKFIKFARE